MKKTILKLSMFVLVAGTLVWTGCKSDDKTAPVITLKGNATETVVYGATYADAGATANDDKDGDITSKITVTVTPTDFHNNVAGAYVYTYNVSDAAGNAATPVTRTVNVVILNTTMDGTYLESENCSGTGNNSGTGTIVHSTSTTGRILISNFALNSSATVYADLSGTFGTTVTIPSQLIGSDYYSGTGTISNNASTITIAYKDSTSAGSQTCTSTYTRQ